MSDHLRPARLECVFFDGDASIYARMARVLRYTARQHCPRWSVSVRMVEPPPLKVASPKRFFVVNAQKLGQWWRTVIQAPIGDRILLIDSDTFIVHPIDDIWDHDFDVAYTVRDFVFPLNGGVVFLRVNARTKAFITQWWRETELMLREPDRHWEWARKFGGLTQASLGAVISTAEHVNLLTVPCSVWNSEDSSWSEFAPGVTRIVHVKSALRWRVFGTPVPKGEQHSMDPNVFALADRWHALEREALMEDQGSAMHAIQE